MGFINWIEELNQYAINDFDFFEVNKFKRYFFHLYKQGMNIQTAFETFVNQL